MSIKLWLKIRRPVIFGGLVLVFFLLQCTIFPSLQLGGVKPDLLIILTVATGIIRGKKDGVLVGFFSGLLIDIQFGEILGFYALIYLVIGYAIGWSKQFFFDEELKLPLILVFFGDFAYGIIIYVLRFLLRSEFHFVYYLNRIIIPQVIYTTIAALAFYPLIRLINRKLEEEEKRSASRFV